MEPFVRRLWSLFRSFICDRLPPTAMPLETTLPGYNWIGGQVPGPLLISAKKGEVGASLLLSRDDCSGYPFKNLLLT